MTQRFHAVFLAGMLLLAMVLPAMAGDQDFVLVNQTGLTIKQVFVSATKTNDWEEDVLGPDVLADDEECEISFDKREEACKYDLKIVDEDGDEVVWGNLNLCEISKVTLHWEDGRAWATIE